MPAPPEAAARRIALVGPLHPWRGGLAQYLQLLGEALERHAQVNAVTFTRQYPGLLFPGTSQFDRQRWTRERARASLDLSGDVALFFGYVRHYKGLDTLLAA